MKKNRVVRLGVIIVCLYLIVTLTGGTVSLWRAGEKVTEREAEVARLLTEKNELLKKKAEVESPAYLEEQAYDKLGLAKPGDQLVIVPPELLDGPETVRREAIPNWKKWLKLIYAN